MRTGGGLGDLEFIKKTIKSSLEKLAEIRIQKERAAAARAEAKRKAEADRLFRRK